MKTKHTLESIEKYTIFGFKDLLKHGGLFQSKIINISALFSIVVSLLLIYIQIDKFSYIKEICILILQFIPGFLGFTIAGYSFLMGFIPDRLMTRISEPQKNSKLSLFQDITSYLAFNIFQHLIILCLGCTFHLIIFIQEKNKDIFHSSVFEKNLVNDIGLIIINLGFFCSLAVVAQIIVSSYNLAQLYHYDVNKAKVEDFNNVGKQE